MKTKEALLKEFNKIQKDIVEAVRLKRYDRIAQLEEEREVIRRAIRLKGR